MPAFRFEAIDSAGRAQKGVIDADSARAARGQLRTQGATPLVVEPAASATRGALAAARVRPQAVAARTGDPHAPAREPPDRRAAARRALGVLTEQAERDYIRELMAAIRAECSAAIRSRMRWPASARLSEIYRALVAAGEHTGKLGIVLSRLSRLHRAEQRAEAEDPARVHVSGDRHADRIRHRHVPAELRRAAGRQRVREHEAAAARADDRDDGAVGFRAPLVVGV